MSSRQAKLEPSSASDLRWRRSNPDHTVWFDGGEDFVVYHRPSGKTHLLNEASSYLLQELLRHPLTLEEIASALEEGGSSDSVHRRSLADTLIRFEQLGLVERV